MTKKLYKDRSTGMISGVLSGFAQYFKVDATILRAGYVILSLFSGAITGLIAYFILAAIMPEKSDVGHDDYTVE